MAGILEEYRGATGSMEDALLRSDDAGIDAALAHRRECIARFSTEVGRWAALPGAERDPFLIDTVRRHHLCILNVDNDLIRRIESMKNEVGEAIVRVGKAGKMRRSYLPSVSARERIVNGEG
ncbi:MAG: hypothetical protein OHK0028_17350 [Deltaproteobacteria bacterium]